jgi:hypothetical protein
MSPLRLILVAAITLGAVGCVGPDKAYIPVKSPLKVFTPPDASEFPTEAQAPETSGETEKHE